VLFARIHGTATATVKHPSLEGWRLLVAQPVGIDGETPDGDPQLVIDTLGAGRGDPVILTSDGKFMANLVDDKKTPARWSVMGMADGNE
jgi:ethanolamine utilization protein EutN